ncbi:hypothetical protein [Clostridium intestinale]|uniref:hypothetical protein n=1 Tax=Clostridium intestinale TaxID=36845 RepID=UPI002DD650E6|nr:hypothetical protein [Clostridium intestinale]WRY53930.1 hypothetical protein P8F83_12120 [Clostridium intestinale]
MNDNLILEAIRTFLIKNVATKIKLEKPPEEGTIDDTIQLVPPAVYIGWIPPKNYLDEFGYDVPGLLVMEDGGEDDDGEAYLNIRIGVATYDVGETINGQLKPNTKGYKDTLNLISIIRTELSRNINIEGVTTVEKPVKWGLYEEQNYPFWHGWITFKVVTPSLVYENNDIEKYL